MPAYTGHTVKGILKKSLKLYFLWFISNSFMFIPLCPPLAGVPIRILDNRILFYGFYCMEVYLQTFLPFRAVDLF